MRSRNKNCPYCGKEIDKYQYILLNYKRYHMECVEKMQKEIETKKEKKWVEDEEEYEDDADVVKLDEGESISGLLVEKRESDLFGYIYKIKTKDDERLKIICGTTVLNKKMSNKVTGEEIMIERTKDEKSKKGLDYQNYKTYHVEE